MALHSAINRRVDKLMEEGLLKEVKHLLSMGYSETPAMKVSDTKNSYCTLTVKLHLKAE